MKYTTLILSAATAIALASPSVAQRRQSGDLAQARATFKAADKDANGKVSPGEAGRARIPAPLFVSFDANADRQLSQDEFTLLYRELVIQSKKSVGADLETEAVRIQAVRRARIVEAQRAKAAAAQDRSDKAAAASRMKAAQRDLKAESVSKTTDATAESTADKLQRAREVVRQDSGTENTATPVLDITASPATLDTPVTPQRTIAAQQLDRSIAVLNRMIREKRLTPDEAREVYALLQQRGRNAVAGVQALPTGAPLTQLFTRARGQLRRLEKNGSLTAAEAREMHAALVERARAAGMADVPAEKPVKVVKTPEAAKPAPVRAVAKTQLERSVVVLNRMIREKRLTPDEARDFYGLLRERAKNSIVNASTPPPSAASVKAMLSRAKAQVATQQRAGVLTADEARELNATLIERARAASSEAPAPVKTAVKKPERAPAKKPGATRTPPKPTGPAGARRGNNPAKTPAKPAGKPAGKPGPAKGRTPAKPTGREKPKPVDGIG